MHDIFNYVLLPNFVHLDRNVISNCDKKPNENYLESPRLTFSPYPLKIKEGEPFQIAFEVDLLKEIPIGTKIELQVYFELAYGEVSLFPALNHEVCYVACDLKFRIWEKPTIIYI